MTTDLGVPAFCACARPRGDHLMQGYGASLSAEHAATRALRTEPNGVCTVTVCVPGLDRFFTVTSGNAVLPGPRGLTRARQAAVR